MIITVLSWLAFGFVVGLVARALFPGTQSMGIVATTGLGIVGSLLGGLVGNVIAGTPALTLHGAGVIGSVLGALLVMALVGFATRRTAVRATV